MDQAPEGNMAASTIRLHRVLRAAPEKVYRAFLDADAMAKWLPPNGFTGKVQHLEAKVGGTHKMSFTNFTTGQSHSLGGCQDVDICISRDYWAGHYIPNWNGGLHGYPLRDIALSLTAS